MTTITEERDLLDQLTDLTGTPLADIDTEATADIVANLLGHAADYEQVPVARFGSAI